MSATTPARLQQALEDAFVSYYETTFRLRDAGIEAARRELLSAENGWNDK